MRFGVSGGQALIETVGMIPVFLLAGLASLQLLSAGYSAVLADHAAEAGALALANHGDPVRAVRGAVPDWSHAQVKTTIDGDVVTVKVRPAAVLSVVGDRLTMSASAVVRRDGGL